MQNLSIYVLVEKVHKNNESRQIGGTQRSLTLLHRNYTASVG